MADVERLPNETDEEYNARVAEANKDSDSSNS